jgi:hypothetical protein
MSIELGMSSVALAFACVFLTMRHVDAVQGSLRLLGMGRTRHGIVRPLSIFLAIL